VNRYDVLVFYDMADSISPAQQQAYINLLNKGASMIFLHHSLVSYQNWPEFIKIVGGQYHTHPVVVNGDTLNTSYEHDVTIPVKVEDKKHPVTKGISDFEIVDGEPDIRGWDVKNATGQKIGEVEDLIIDARLKKVRYMVVDLDDNDLDIKHDKVAIPIGLAELDKKETEYQDSVALISQKSRDLEKRHREIDTEVEAPKAK